MNDTSQIDTWAWCNMLVIYLLFRRWIANLVLCRQVANEHKLNEGRNKGSCYVSHTDKSSLNKDVFQRKKKCQKKRTNTQTHTHSVEVKKKREQNPSKGLVILCQFTREEERLSLRSRRVIQGFCRSSLNFHRVLSENIGKWVFSADDQVEVSPVYCSNKLQRFERHSLLSFWVMLDSGALKGN